MISFCCQKNIEYTDGSARIKRANAMTSNSQIGDVSFPFSPSPFSDRGTPERARLYDLSSAGINEARIPEGRLRDGSSGGYPVSKLGGMNIHASASLRNARQLASLRPGIRPNGLRLLPLASFAWGSRGAAPRPRTSPDHVLLWITAGEMKLEFPREQRILPYDSVQYIPSGTAFSAFPGSNAQGIAVFLSPSIQNDSASIFLNQRLAKAVGDNASELAALIDEIGAEAEKSPLDPKTLHQPLLALAVLLDNLEPVRQPQHRAAPDTSLHRSLAERFLLEASGQLETGRTVAEIAADLNISTAMLDRACRETYRKRPIELMNELRLRQATDLLRHSNLSVSQIAQKLGYTSLTHFTRSFVASTGRSPEAFRGQSV